MVSGNRIAWLAASVWMCSGIASSEEPPVYLKEASALYPQHTVDRVRLNVSRFPWAAGIQEGVVARARDWAERSDDELWDLMFGPTLTRSWMVWSNGHCPSCDESVPMYNWEIDALERPWKVRCPHCGEEFPKNDFEAFYRSGLDERSVFDPSRADRSLLFNADHPDATDPLHGFGVDDGEGYVADGNRWRFIGTYLIYGQWKQAVLGGVRTLAAAYVLTGDAVYAHKAAVMLDRVADLYPAFNFKEQAWVYERQLGSTGYVSIWHDACEETRELALAYDMIFEGIRDDEALVEFLGGKARELGLENPKASIQDIQRNIETRILRDAVDHREKIHSNYPRTEIAIAIILEVLGGEENRLQAESVIDAMLEKATAVDGVTGEKGLANYSAFVIQALARFLGEFAKADPEFLPNLLERHPQLHQTYRFHVDTWCLHQYYPQSGDTGWFAKPHDRYVGVTFSRPAASTAGFGGWSSLAPSMFTFLWELYEATGDTAFAQVIYRANDHQVAGLPHDLYVDDAEAIREGVGRVVEREGSSLHLPSVDKQQWHIAILRSGEGSDARAAWLDYDSGGGHSHADGMNLGLFAKGLDLMPDFGYPPVQFGGWDSTHSRWYTRTLAHNTVVVDRANTSEGAGRTTMWADGEQFRAIRVDGPEMNGGRRYERTVAMVDVSSEEAYLVDVFRVAGGREHLKLMHSHFGQVTSAGLSLEEDRALDLGEQMRNVRIDPAPEPGWHVDWAVEDRYEILDPGASVHLRYTDLTRGTQAGLAEAWVVAGGYSSTEEAWIPRVLIRREAAGDEPLASTFVAIVEPHEKTPAIADIRRVEVRGVNGEALPDTHAGIVVSLADGRRDIFIARDPMDAAVSEVAISTEPTLQTDAELCMVRLMPDGRLAHAALCHGSFVRIGDEEVRLGSTRDFAELSSEGPAP